MSNDGSSETDSLSNSFDKALSFFNELENSNLSSNDPKYQEKVKLAIGLLEQSTEFVNKLGLFSVNETIDDVATANIKYLLLPALLGYFTIKLTGKDRYECVKIADIYFKDYLKRVQSYEICRVEIDLNNLDDDEEEDEDKKNAKQIRPPNVDLETMGRERQAKVESYRKKKEIEEKLDNFEEIIKTNDNVSDEQKREYYILLIKKWVASSVDEVLSIKKEKEILSQMAKMGGKRPELKEAPKKSSLKPFIITRNEIQKKVYGLGYPSLPTMSIEQFVETKIQEGSLSEAKPGQTNSLMEWAKNPDFKKQQDEDDAAVKEEAEEKEDLEALKKARGWDEFKDENKRGWGNRYNRS